jgi:hypothetical protein
MRHALRMRETFLGMGIRVTARMEALSAALAVHGKTAPIPSPSVRGVQGFLQLIGGISQRLFA